MINGVEAPVMHERAAMSESVHTELFRATVDDIEFLARIGIQLNPNDVDEFNRLLEIGETDCRTIADPTDVYSVREEITSMSTLLKSVQTKCTAVFEPSKYLTTLRFLNDTDKGVDLAKIVISKPETLEYSSESVARKIENLQRLVPGVDLAKVVNAMPIVLGLNPESVARKIENLQRLVPGVDLAKVVNAMPAVLSCSTESLLLKACIIKSLNQWDRIVADLCSDEPKCSFFTLPTESFILRACDVDLSANLYGSNSIIKKRGIANGADRKQEAEKILGLLDITGANPEIVQKLELAGIFYAAKHLKQPLRLFG